MSEPFDYKSITNLERWMITFTVMLVAVIEVLDMTVVNVSLDQMSGSFGATTEQITWVLTAYIVSSAIMMPLSGRLVQLFGRRTLLLITITGFLAASIMCGVSTSLGEIVLFRTLQGLFGASLVPISQYVLRDIFPPQEQGKAMAIWGLGIMVAPVMGPTLGGYITQHFDWRWIFYINVPVCVVGLILTLSFIPETKREKIKIDWVGLILMAIGIGCLQVFLDRGNQDDWLQSNFILTLAITSFVALTFFIIRGIYKPDNIVKLQLFKERNFTASTMGLFGIIALQPMMLERLLNYPTEVAGLAMGPRGIASACAMMVIGPLARKVSARKLVTIGILASLYGTWGMMHYTIDMSFWDVVKPTLWQGVGLGFVMIPLSTVAFDYLDKRDTAEASGLFSFGRSLGMSIGISILGTIATNLTQINWNRLGGFLNPFNPQFVAWAQQQHMNIHDPMAIQLAARTLGQQANMVAYLDAFKAVFVLLVIMLFMVPLIKKPQQFEAQ